MKPQEAMKLPAGDEIDNAVDRMLGMSPSEVRGSDGRRRRTRQYSRNTAAAWWAFDEYWGGMMSPTAPDGSEREPLVRIQINNLLLSWVCVASGDYGKDGDWESYGNGPTLALAICRCLLDEQSDDEEGGA